MSVYKGQQVGLLLLLLMVLCATSRLPSYSVQYFLQPVDHFSFTVSDTFLQRYLIADKFWNTQSGPVFFYTGNEGDIVWFYNNTGLIFDWAQEFEALVIFAEHRYYGVSLPYGNQSFEGLDHIGYLSSEQALADFANLIGHLKATSLRNSNNPFVAFGGSYGGMLAAWLRMKYPNAVIGSLAASAPIWMFGDLVPCNSFYEIVTHDFELAGSSCVSNIRRLWKVLSLYAQSASGLATLTKSLSLCKPLQSETDVSQLKDWLSETWVNLAMVDYPYAASFLEPLPAWPIKAVCSHLLNESLSDLELLSHLRAAVGVYYNFTGSVSCFNINQTAVASLGDKVWEFQECTEMVMPTCTNGVTDMFEPNPWNLTAFTNDCEKNWNVKPQPDKILTEYSGKNIRSASNIIFSNGDLDPWSAGGVLTSLSDSLIAIIIKDGAHHLDLRSSRPDDIQSVVIARRKEKAIVKSWIEQYWNTTSRHSKFHYGQKSWQLL